jgi:aryl-alcohol dehydrogenase-like predicted oxidoreductase
MFAIPGTRNISRMEENVGALDVVLSEDEVAQISEAFPPGAAAGTRYPTGAMKHLYV